MTRVTLRTHELPDMFGAVFGAIKASSDAAFKALIAEAMAFYRRALFNPSWGEQMVFQSNNTLRITMLFQGISEVQARATWAPFLEWAAARNDYMVVDAINVVALPAVISVSWGARWIRGGNVYGLLPLRLLWVSLSA